MTAEPQPEWPTIVRAAVDSRPPADETRTAWPEPPSAAQPTLPIQVGSSAPAPKRSATAGLVAPVLDADQWSAALALAVFETLHGRRPVGQLTRWVDDRVQSVLAFHRRRAGSVTPGRPAVVRSIRIQHPRPDVAEVCAHLSLSGRSYALALRLEVWGDRWLCTAVEFG